MPRSSPTKPSGSRPPLPAAVEVAAYRIALEAMNNAARHADARNSEVRLSLDEEPDMLILEVSDDGHGIGEDRGEAIFGPAIARRLMQYFATPRPSALPDAFPELNEREILALIARHETNPAIAKRLYLSPKTVRNHVSNIFTKLQVADRAQAIIRAREAGLGREGP
jgi:DNA-binding CsgD family transcriptional regulator